MLDMITKKPPGITPGGFSVCAVSLLGLSDHELGKELTQRGMSLKRQNGRNVLVRPNHDHTALVTINAALGEDVVLGIDLEHLFIVSQTKPALGRPEIIWHLLDSQILLLEHRIHIDYRIDIGACRGIFFHWRGIRAFQEVHQLVHSGICIPRILSVAEHKYTPATISLVQVPQVDRTAIRHAYRFGRMEALTDGEAGRKHLVFVPGTQI